MNNGVHINNIEELPQVKLDSEDKTRVIKGLILLFLFSSVVIASMVYYNAPNYNPNLILEGSHSEEARFDKHLHNNPVYRLESRYMATNCNFLFNFSHSARFETGAYRNIQQSFY